MRVDIVELMKADTLAVLKGWEKSRGAQLEFMIAALLGMPIVNAYTLEQIEIKVNVEAEYPKDEHPRGEGPR